MAKVIDEIEHRGEKWQLKVDTRGRHYAVVEGHGRVSVSLYKAAKAHDPIENYV